MLEVGSTASHGNEGKYKYAFVKVTQQCKVGKMPFAVTPSAKSKRLQTFLPDEHAGPAIQNCALAGQPCGHA